jgi:hypothetical protein
VEPPVTDGVSAPGPVFLAGADRSGIGLLGELLERHPSLAMTRRTDFWDRFAGRYGDLEAPSNVDRLLEDLAGDRRGRVFEPDRDRLLAQLARDPTYSRLFELLQRQRMERLGKVRWGDKSLDQERHADLLLRSYPAARVIHVLRDPRDRYASQKEHRQGGRGRVAAGAAVWWRSARLAERNLRRYPDRYLVIRYETLVTHPETTLRGVCDFIGEPYLDALLDGPDRSDPTAAPTDDGPGRIHTRSIGAYTGLLSPQEVLTLQLTLGRWMTRHGYEREAVPLSGSARWRYVLGQLPLHVLSMLAWERWVRVRAIMVRPTPR